MKMITILLALLCLPAQAQEKINPDFTSAPNPHFIRMEMRDLNGAWRITEGGQTQNIQVPYVPQAKKSGVSLAGNLELVEYERELLLPEDWAGGLLHFEGVDFEAEVFFNGHLVGQHTGGYDPFRFDVSDLLKFGEPAAGGRRHKLQVRVRDSNTSLTQLTGKQERVPNEGVIFYRNMTGIWKSVWIEKINPTHIEEIQIESDMNGRFTIKAPVAGTKGKRLTARVTMRFEKQNVVFEEEVPVVRGRIQLQGSAPNVKTWSPDTPNLYFLNLDLMDENGTLVDQALSYTGFRTFEQREGYFFLNGKPFQLRGVLDQVIYPDTLYTPTEEDMVRDISYSKAAGFNGARIHQTTPNHRRLWLADRMGFWSSVELPSARNLTQEKDFNEALRQWDAILKSYSFGRPTVFYVVPVNEDWGWLEDHDSGAGVEPHVRERVQHAAYQRSRASAPRGMIVSAEDGWRTISRRKNGRELRSIKPGSLMSAMHDYRTAEELRITYGPVPGYTWPGTVIPENGKRPFLEGYEYDGQSALVISEAGGRAVTLSNNPKIFAYGSLFRDTAAWGKEMSDVVVTLGSLPVVRGGFVITQLRDAGNDPSDPDSQGELNGILTADGQEKIPAKQFRAANRKAYLGWEANRAAYLLVAGCESLLASGD